jgi:prepilin-type N-terminal cleavage/methylation domain-containing protein
MSTARDPRRRRQHGLTLLEVVVSLAILSLLSTAIYSIIIGAVDATASLAAIESENRRINAFLEQSRSAFAHFPQGASAELKIIESKLTKHRQNEIKQ